MLVDMPQPVEDEAHIVVPLSLLRSANGVLPRSFADRLSRSATAVPSESSGIPLPEDLRAAQLRLFILRRPQSSNCALEMRIGNFVIRSASSVSQLSGCWAVVTPNPALQPYG